MGLKNCLFGKNGRGAEDNAVFYSLLESCQIVGTDLLRWLTHALQKLADYMTTEENLKLYFHIATKNLRSYA